MSDVRDDPVAVAAREFERAIARNIKGLGYFASPAPALGASLKDVLIGRGTMQLYHYHVQSDEVYRVPILLVMAKSACWSPPRRADRVSAARCWRKSSASPNGTTSRNSPRR